MMRLFAVSLFLIPAFVHAADGTVTLLDCNTSAGPDQQVTVKQTGNDLTLIELSVSGRQTQRSLSKEEWDSGTLLLQDGSLGEKATLRHVTDGWMFESIGTGIKESGYADCWIEPSKGG